MAHSLLAYSASNDFNPYNTHGVTVSIKKAENGFIFTLSGEKDVPKAKKDVFRDTESFSAQFVYSTLSDGLAEVESFFKLIDKQLDKKIAERPVVKRGRPQKLMVEKAKVTPNAASHPKKLGFLDSLFPKKRGRPRKEK